MLPSERIALLRERAEVLGLASSEPLEPLPPTDVVVEARQWRQNATSAVFRMRQSPLAGVLGQRGRW